MSAITEPAQDLLEQTRDSAHPLCLVCGRALECGLGLRFVLREDGGVDASFKCAAAFQGYAGVLHGGVTSLLVDGAMTNCLFAYGIVAVTAEMTVRFRQPITLSSPVRVQANILRSQAPLHIVHAEVIQDGQVKTEATGKFLERRAGSVLP